MSLVMICSQFLISCFEPVSGARTRDSRPKTFLLMVVQSSYHAKRELVGLVFRISPKHIVAHFVVDHIDPASFRVIFSASLPIFWVNQINLAIFISLAGG